MGNGQSAFASPESLTWGISYGADVAAEHVADSPLYGRLPGPNEALEAIRLGEEDIRAGRVVPVEETIEKMRHIIARHKKV